MGQALLKDFAQAIAFTASYSVMAMSMIEAAVGGSGKLSKGDKNNIVNFIYRKKQDITTMMNNNVCEMESDAHFNFDALDWISVGGPLIAGREAHEVLMNKIFYGGLLTLGFLFAL